MTSEKLKTWRRRETGSWKTWDVLVLGLQKMKGLPRGSVSSQCWGFYYQKKRKFHLVPSATVIPGSTGNRHSGLSSGKEQAICLQTSSQGFVDHDKYFMKLMPCKHSFCSLRTLLKTALRGYNWYTKNSPYLVCTVWWVPTRANICDTKFTVKVTDLSNVSWCPDNF